MANVDTDWEYRGLRVVRLENDLISLDVLPELGSKIYNFIHKPSRRNLLWHNSRIPPARQAFGACFDDNWSGGWDELIPNDVPCPEPDGDMLPDHGEFWSLATDWEVVQSGGACAEVRFRSSGRVMPVTFEKILSVRDGESFFRVHYRLTNHGPAAFDFNWNIHPAMAISPDTRLDVPAAGCFTDPWREKLFPGYGRFQWPLLNDHTGKQWDLSRVEPPESQIADQQYMIGIREGWYAVTDQRHQVGFGLVFPTSVFPNVWLFRTYGGWRGLYTLILEASTGCSRNLKEAREKNQCGHLAPGQMLEVEVLAVAYSGMTGVSKIGTDGRVFPAGSNPERNEIEYMNVFGKRCLPLLGMALCTLAPVYGADLPRWQTHDFAFKSDTKHDNPFTVDFSADVTGPNGIHFVQAGFYDGDGTWKLRLGPNVPGKWTVKTHSSDTQLNLKTGELNCVEQQNPRVHGGLLVDPEHTHHFIREDGTRFFYSGFECDWLWAIDLAACNPSLPQTSILLDKLVDYDFNVVYVNLYAHTYGAGKGTPNFGPPAKYPWAGSNDKPDFSTFNLPFWQHFDRVLEALRQRGIEAHLMIKVYNKHVNWPAPGSPEDNRFFQYVVARFAPFCNVHWDFAKESNRDKDLAYKLGRMALIRKNDPYRRLLTTHTDNDSYPEYLGVLDYRTAQKHKDWHSSPVTLLKKEPWPNVDAEYGYECGPGGTNDTPSTRCEDARTIYNRAWEVYTLGRVWRAYYYAYTVVGGDLM